ncbi:hypothetical protein GGF46_000622 [Coemansia sp. RSA 552]|nr:hypothetical protein GGF46_000622 [Coemansia sp. RSA 552]
MAPPQPPSADSSEGESDSGQLWIAPKASRTSIAQTEQTELTAPSAAKEKPPVEETRRRARRSSGKELRRLSAVRLLAWYAPRLVFLLFIGWSWSVGVQFIHAQERGLTGADSASRLAPGFGRWGGVEQTVSGDEGTMAGEYDSSDSDDDGTRTQWRAADSSGLARDVIARVLATASWSDGISGLMTVVVGLGYPFLDWRWRSYPRHAVEWHDVLRCVGGFLGVNFAALKLPFESAHQSALLMLIISLGLWTVCDGTLHGLLLSATMALGATLMLLMHALSGGAAFSQDDCLGLLAFLPSVVFTYCVMTGSIGRSLGHHPQWHAHQSRPRPRAKQGPRQ